MTTNRFDEARAAHVRGAVADIRKRISRAEADAGRAPGSVRLMAVTKTVPPDIVNVAIAEGIDLLGENRAQELSAKYDSYALKADHIHFIGHLQSNKVRAVIDKVSMIESVDTVSLAKEINRQAEKRDRILPVLLEVNIGAQETKSGFMEENLSEALHVLDSLSHIRVQGLMAIPPQERQQYYFQRMQQLYIDISAKSWDNSTMQFLSMGMSGDFEAAIACGSNIVRIGSALFGSRPSMR